MRVLRELLNEEATGCDVKRSGNKILVTPHEKIAMPLTADQPLSFRQVGRVLLESVKPSHQAQGSRMQRIGSSSTPRGTIPEVRRTVPSHEDTPNYLPDRSSSSQSKPTLRQPPLAGFWKHAELPPVLSSISMLRLRFFHLLTTRLSVPSLSPAVLGAASDLIAGIAPPIEKGENRLGRPTSSPLGFSGCRIPFYDPGWSRLEVNADHSTNRRRPIRTRLRR